MTGLKAQLNRKLHECGRDPLSLFLLGCVIAAALITFMVLSFLLGYILCLVIVVFCSEKRALAEDQACNAGLLSLRGARASLFVIICQNRLKVQILCNYLRFKVAVLYAHL